ncbi:MAG: hypothetical protein ACLQDV_17125 [Candidatus Binataceae bacterium]
MPRSKRLSAFSQLQQYAQRLLAGLATEIRAKKAELARLEQEFGKLTGIAGLHAAVSAPKRAPATSHRINWSEVLAKLPKEFKASDIRNVRGLKGKSASELFAAITRWIDSGAAKKKERGIYLRLK